MTPKVAVMGRQMSERVFESIPGAMLTAATLLGSADARSLSTLVSMLLACLATAFVATTIAYNYDTDAEKRSSYPAVYG